MADKGRMKRQEWMTDEILDLMEQRQSFMGKKEVQYDFIDLIIGGKIREANEAHLENSCKEI